VYNRGPLWVFLSNLGCMLYALCVRCMHLCDPKTETRVSLHRNIKENKNNIHRQNVPFAWLKSWAEVFRFSTMYDTNNFSKLKFSWKNHWLVPHKLSVLGLPVILALFSDTWSCALSRSTWRIKSMCYKTWQPCSYQKRIDRKIHYEWYLTQKSHVGCS